MGPNGFECWQRMAAHGPFRAPCGLCADRRAMTYTYCMCTYGYSSCTEIDCHTITFMDYGVAKHVNPL